MVVECNPWCVLEQDTYISTCNQTETVVECNPWCVLEGDTQISTCNQTKSVGEGNPYAQINLNMSSITAQMITYVSYCTYLYHNKIMSYKVMLFTCEYHVWCLTKPVDQNHPTGYGTGHFIFTILLDFTDLSFHFILSVLYITLNLLKFLLDIFRLILTYEWPPYIQNLDLFTIYGCLVKHVSVHEWCMGTWLSLIHNMFRRHDFALFKTLCILCRRLAVLFLIAFYLSRYLPVDPYHVQVAWNNKYKSSHAYIKEAFSDTLTRHNLYGGGKSFVSIHQ